MNPERPVEITPELLQQNPALALCLTLFVLFVLAGIIGTLISWGYVGFLLWKKRPLLPAMAWEPRPWGLVDLVLTAFVVIAVQALASWLAVPLLKIDVRGIQANGQIPMSLAAAISAGYLLTVLLVSCWILRRYQAAPSILGWSTRGLFKKLLIGLVAGLSTLPFILAISAAVSLGLKTEYEHPILEAMEREGRLSSYLLALFSAVVAAPIAEEFLFRVLIQGWLQSIPFSNLRQILLGRVPDEPPAGSLSEIAPYDAGDAGAAESLTRLHDPFLPPRVNLAEGEWPVASGTAIPTMAASSDDSTLEVSLIDGEHNHTRSPARFVAPLWPSFVSGILFGLAHWEYGLSFIPLIALGIVLGLLYRATQSIWPSIILHFMLNFSSMLALGINLYLDKVSGT